MWSNDDVKEIVFKRRKSYRNFSQKQIDEKLLSEIMDVGLCAPVAGGIKSVKIQHINNEADLKICYKASFYQKAIYNATAVITVSVNLKMIEEKYKEPYASRFALQNGAVAMMNMINFCSFNGIASCYIGGIRSELFQNNLCQEDERMVAILLLGYEVENDK